MQNIREFVNKSPWVGWIVAGLILLVAVWLYFRPSSNESPYSPERMREMVSIKFTDTGDVIEMTRGDLDRMLRRRGETVDAGQGVVNPKTNLPTGFLYDKSEWDAMVARINAEKKEIKETTGMDVAPAPRSDLPRLPENPAMNAPGTQPAPQAPAPK
jgi:hypothetical protein